MSITTNNLKVREVINQVVNDPEYQAVSHVPIFSWPQIALILIAYGGVFGGMALHVYADVSLWLVYPLMIFAFYTAFTPLHDSTHRAVSSNKLLNDILGTLSGTLLFPLANAVGYRYLHLSHHRYVGDKDLDPDEPMVGIPTQFFPFGYLSLLFPDVIWSHWLLIKAWKRTPTSTRWNVLSMIFGNVLFHVAWFLSPFWYEYLLLFFIPNRVAIAYTALTFAHAPHPEGMPWNEFPFSSTFSLKGNKLLELSLYGQKHHSMHHFMPHIPWFKYVKVWDLANGVFRKQNIPEKEVFARPDRHFKEKFLEKRDPNKNGNLLGRITSIEQTAENIKTFVIKPANEGDDFPEFTAGSHIQVHLPSGKMRSYSLVNPPFEQNRYQIAVKKEEEGNGGSKEMHELSVGDTLQISQPHNNFVLYENVQKYLLISGGIGITPMLSMAHRLTEIDRHFELHVCAKKLEEVPFRYGLQNWTFAPNVEIHLDKDGRSSMDIKRVLASPNTDTLLYVCGPPGFNKWVQQAALELGWNRKQIRLEAFSQDPHTFTEAKAFELELRKSGKTLTVPADQTIIDTLQLHNIKTPYSCLQGTCGTCITPVIEGEVDHRDAVLSEEEKCENKQMCLCVSRAKGEKLVVDL